jgi:Lon protease-like protein
MADEPTQRLLPIFPLPLVQFPGAVTPLHVFEERYRKMLRDIMLADKTFGITYRGEEPDTGARAPEVGSVGCTVEVLTLQAMPDGRANILCAGGARYRTLAYVEGEPYLQAEVELFDDEPGVEDLTEETSHAARLFGRIIAATKKLKGASPVEQADVPELPEDASALSFIIASSLDLQAEEKQALLEMTVTANRLHRLTALLEQLVTAYEHRARVHLLSQYNGHGGAPPS